MTRRSALVGWAVPGKNRYNFVKLNAMEAAEPNVMVDVIALVKNYEDCSTIMTR